MRQIPTVAEVHELIVRQGIPFRGFVTFHAEHDNEAINPLAMGRVKIDDVVPCYRYTVKIGQLFDRMARDISPDMRNPWKPRVIETWLWPRKRFYRTLLFARTKALQGGVGGGRRKL